MNSTHNNYLKTIIFNVFWNIAIIYNLLVNHPDTRGYIISTIYINKYIKYQLKLEIGIKGNSAVTATTNEWFEKLYTEL